MNNLKQIFKEYSTKELVKSQITAAIFYLLLAALVLIPSIVVMLLFVPYMQYFLIFIYICFAFINIYTNKIFVETLLSYKQPNINFEQYKLIANVVMTIITFIVIFSIYVYLN